MRKYTVEIIAILIVGVCLAQYYAVRVSRQPLVGGVFKTESAKKVPTLQDGGCAVLPYNSPTPLHETANTTLQTEDVRGGVLCKFEVVPGDAPFIFTFKGEGDNTLSSVTIVKEGANAPLQKIVVDIDPNAVAPESMAHVIDFKDMNFDGYMDMPILVQCGATGNCSYDVYLYDKKTQQFIHNDFLSSLGTFELDKDMEQITVSRNSSYADGERDTYQYDIYTPGEDRYYLVKKVVSSWDRQHGLVTKKTYELKKGELQLVSSTSTKEGL